MNFTGIMVIEKIVPGPMVMVMAIHGENCRDQHTGLLAVLAGMGKATTRQRKQGRDDDHDQPENFTMMKNAVHSLT